MHLNPHFKGGKGYLLVAFFLLLIFFSLSIAYFFYGLKSLAETNKIIFPLIKIKIERGDGLKEIGAVLSQKKIIRSVSVFKLYSLLKGLAHRFKPGVYELNGTFTVPEITALLAAGRPDASVTILEGATLKEIDRLIASADILKRGELLNFSASAALEKYPFGLIDISNLEGFIFPDTYRLSFNASVGEVADIFLNNFAKKAWPLLKDKKNWYQVLIKASIIEKEIPDFVDRRLVSGIMDQRLSSSMPLQIDATLVYEKCSGFFIGCENVLLKKEDFEKKSPYNTYKILGLPIAPISNPGQSAIEAALDPQPSSFWYYLSDRKTKKTYFSKTLEEHNNYRAKYLNL